MPHPPVPVSSALNYPIWEAGSLVLPLSDGNSGRAVAMAVQSPRCARTRPGVDGTITFVLNVRVNVPLFKKKM